MFPSLSLPLSLTPSPLLHPPSPRSLSPFSVFPRSLSPFQARRYHPKRAIPYSLHRPRVQVVVVVVAQQHHVDAGQLGHGQGWRPEPLRTHHLTSRCSLREHRVGQDVQAVNLAYFVVGLRRHRVIGGHGKCGREWGWGSGVQSCHSHTHHRSTCISSTRASAFSRGRHDCTNDYRKNDLRKHSPVALGPTPRSVTSETPKNSTATIDGNNEEKKLLTRTLNNVVCSQPQETGVCLFSVDQSVPARTPWRGWCEKVLQNTPQEQWPDPGKRRGWSYLEVV